MKKSIAQLGIVLTAALLVFGLAACPTDGGDPGNKGGGTSDKAELTSLSIAGETVTIPAAISGEEWEDLANMNGLAAELTGSVVVPSADLLVATEITVAVSAGATVNYDVATGTTKPADFPYQKDGNPAISSQNFLYIRVTAENGTTVNYYRVQVLVAGSNANLTRIRAWDGTDDAINATQGTPTATWTAANGANGSLSLAMSAVTNVPIIVSKAAGDQAVYFAYVAAASMSAEPQWGEALPAGAADRTVVTSVAEAKDGDFLCFKVVAGDKETINFYKIEVSVGRNANLTNIKFGEAAFTTMGTPNANAASAVSAPALMSVIQPADGFDVSATVVETGATATFATGTGSTVPTAFNAEGKIIFNNGDFLYVKVVAGNGTTTQYYKLEVRLVQTGTIKYGRPLLDDGKIASGTTISDLWDGLEEYPIERVYGGDSASLPASNKTKGIAKALWDDEGLYVYWKITDPTNGKATTGGDHTSDSIELFVNEAYNPATPSDNTYSTGGSQYRVGSNNNRSGDPAAAVTAFGNLGQNYAWDWDEGGDNKGYVVVMYIPWRFGSFMIDTQTGFVIDNKQIGLEFQINECVPSGTRLGVLCWNNSQSGNYQNTSRFGVVTLEAPGVENPRVILAERPAISAQPAGAAYEVGAVATALSVTAAVAHGEMSYQWYKSSTPGDNEGEAIGGATTTTFTPDTAAAGRVWYWCVITNYYEGASEGNETAETVSAKALIRVVDSSAAVAAYEVTYASGEKINETANAAQYATLVTIDVSDVDVLLYNKFEITANVYSDAEKTEKVTVDAMADVTWVFNDNSTVNNWNLKSEAVHQFSEAGLTAMLAAAEAGGGLKELRFRTDDASVTFIEVLSIKFSKE